MHRSGWRQSLIKNHGPNLARGHAEAEGSGLRITLRQSCMRSGGKHAREGGTAAECHVARSRLLARMTAGDCEATRGGSWEGSSAERKKRKSPSI